MAHCRSSRGNVHHDFRQRLVTPRYGGSGTGAVLVALGLASIVLGIRWLEHDTASGPVVFRVMGAAGSDFCANLWVLLVLSAVHSSLSWEFPFNLSIPHHSWNAIRARLNREGPVSYVGVNLIAVAACRFFLREWRRGRAKRCDGAQDVCDPC